MFLPKPVLEEKLRRFLEEDLGQGDITSELVVPRSRNIRAEIIVKEGGIVAGIDEALVLCESLGLRVKSLVSDGSEAKIGTPILRIEGDARTLLSAERTLLNLVSRMSGITTITNKLVRRLREAGSETRIASTRKVGLGLSYFDKKAVQLGGGDTHRLHLDDLVLIKDNHVRVAGSVKEALARAQKAVSFSKRIEVEVSSREEALEAAEFGADIIMLDNFSPEEVAGTVALLKKKHLRDRVVLEASGGITESNLLKYSAIGVDVLSLGKITHSSKALDMSLEVLKQEK